MVRIINFSELPSGYSVNLDLNGVRYTIVGVRFADFQLFRKQVLHGSGFDAFNKLKAKGYEAIPVEASEENKEDFSSIVDTWLEEHP